MSNPNRLSVAERLYGLSLIWQEANYNFAFFDRVPDLDWDAAYRAYVPRVIAAEDLAAYYDLLARFAALLADGHTLVVPPRSVFDSLDRPALSLMAIEGRPIVTNAAHAIAAELPIGSQLLEIDGAGALEGLAERVLPVVCETTAHRRLAHATARLLLGPRGSRVRCLFRAPAGNPVELELVRNRRDGAEPWVRTRGTPDRWEYVTFDEWFFQASPLTPFAFRMLEGNIAYVALNTFMDPAVTERFREQIPAIRGCAGLILDLRKNHGGSDTVCYGIASHLIQRSTETILVRTPRHIASYRAVGVNFKNTSAEGLGALSEGDRERLLCYRRQWMHEESWGCVQPAQESLAVPTVVLTSPETVSAAEDFLMALESGGARATRIGGPTAGSTGQPLIEGLPGGGMLGICTIRMPWPEAIWRHGIEPHIRVEPAIEDVIEDRDLALATALQFLTGGDAAAQVRFRAA